MKSPIVVCVGLTVSLAMAPGALAQGAPGYRMRPPPAVPPVRLGGLDRPPRLTASPPAWTDSRAGRRRFVFPYVFFDGHPLGISDYYYADDSADYSADGAQVQEVDPADYSTEVKPPARVQALDDTTAVGRLQVKAETSGSQSLVRLTWRNEQKITAAQVAFFLADSTRTILSAQTVRAAPFTATFEPGPRMAFAGMTVVLPGGTLVTQFLPYRPPR